MKDDLTEEALTLLAVLALGVKNGHVTIDEALVRAFHTGDVAGRLRGIADAQRIMNGEKA